MAAAIEMPTVGGIQKNLMSYGSGILAGIGYNLVANFTGSGLIGGAVSAAVAGSLVRGVVGEMIAVNAGFNVGTRGLPGLGLGNLFPTLGATATATATDASGTGPNNFDLNHSEVYQ